MSSRTSIEWTRGDDGSPGATWNPTVGCTKVSPGCDHCYAEGLVNRFAGTSAAFPNRFDTVTLRPQMLDRPLRWRKPRRVFVNSLSDLFHKDVPDDYIARVFSVMAAAPQHTFQLLTKRHARMRTLLNDPHFLDLTEREWCNINNWTDARIPEPEFFDTMPRSDFWPLPNVWLGISAEDQHWANLRVPALLYTPAAIRFVSAEPLLGPIDFDDINGLSAITPDWVGSAAGGTGTPHPLLDWVIVGGESGGGARPMHPDWVRSLRDQCNAADVAFFMKQTGAVLAREWGIPGKGDNSAVWPESFPREYPDAPALTDRNTR